MSQTKLHQRPSQQTSGANENKNLNDKGKQMGSQKDIESTIAKVEEKANPVLLILTLGIVVTSTILVTWCVITRKAQNCEKKEALELLNVDYVVSCSYDDAKKKIETIFTLGCVSGAVSLLFLLLRLPLSYAPTEKIKNARLILYYIFYAVVCLGISVSLLFFTFQMLDSKTSQKPTVTMDHGTLKKMMFKSLVQNYTSDVITSSKTMSDRWNTFFIKYDCCAVNQVMGTTNDFDTTPWCTTSGSCQLKNSAIPKTCCKDVTEEDYVNATSSCHATVTAGSYKDSCFTRVKNLSSESLKEYQIDVIITCSLTLAIIMSASFLQVLVLILTYCVFKRCESSTKCCYSCCKKLE